jgi:hypothetical protein
MFRFALFHTSLHSGRVIQACPPRVPLIGLAKVVASAAVAHWAFPF